MSGSTELTTGGKMTAILATDCGSTTTKAILIEKVGDQYRQTFRGEADRKSTRLNSSHIQKSRMPSSA